MGQHSPPLPTLSLSSEPPGNARGCPTFHTSCLITLRGTVTPGSGLGPCMAGVPGAARLSAPLAPPSVHSGHSGLTAVALALQSYSHLRAFAHAFPFPLDAPPQIFTTSSSFSSFRARLGHYLVTRAFLGCPTHRNPTPPNQTLLALRHTLIGFSSHSHPCTPPLSLRAGTWAILFPDGSPSAWNSIWVKQAFEDGLWSE